MTSSSRWRNEGPKIVQIETFYVETDAVNFRDVVQRLTGKNSASFQEANKGEIAKADDDGIKKNISSNVAVVSSSSMVVKEDFDGLLSDFPSMEDLLCM
ncbi:hypothetical protein SESBI_07740 [Sesbania bispinosa]|nr:hypothetical protein SESBI_07740 [Sesbania bispinosa]